MKLGLGISYVTHTSSSQSSAPAPAAAGLHNPQLVSSCFLLKHTAGGEGKLQQHRLTAWGWFWGDGGPEHLSLGLGGRAGLKDGAGGGVASSPDIGTSCAAAWMPLMALLVTTGLIPARNMCASRYIKPFQMLMTQASRGWSWLKVF